MLNSNNSLLSVDNIFCKDKLLANNNSKIIILDCVSVNDENNCQFYNTMQQNINNNCNDTYNSKPTRINNI